MILPLRIALLWHQHQPYYRKGNHFILPWVRLHAAKDYWDLPALAEQFPSLKQTINIVPSLLVGAIYVGFVSPKIKFPPVFELVVLENH